MNVFKQIGSLTEDWFEFLKDNHFQEDLMFLLIIFAGKIFNVYSEESFLTLALVIIGGDVIKKVGAKK